MRVARIAARTFSFKTTSRRPKITAYKRTRITIETDQVLIIRRRGCTRHWCRECGQEVDMVSLSQAAALAGVAQPLPLDWPRAKKWHVTEAGAGSTLICLDSLLNVARLQAPNSEGD